MPASASQQSSSQTPAKTSPHVCLAPDWSATVTWRRCRCRRPFWYRSKTFDFLFQLFSQLSSKLSSGCSSNNSSEVKKWVKHLLDFFERFSVFAENTVQPSNILLSQWVVLLFVRFFFYFDPTILTVWKKCHACIRKDETAVQQKMESFERSVSSIFMPTEI